MPLPENPDIRLRRDDQWRDHPEHQRRSVDAGVGAGADGGSADLLCQFGSSFVEAGLGLGLSALHIARHPNTQRHIVVEFYDEVIRLFRERNTSWPSSLQIVRGDFFEYIRSLQPSSLDGMFFDPGAARADQERRALLGRDGARDGAGPPPRRRADPVLLDSAGAAVAVRAPF